MSKYTRRIERQMNHAALLRMPPDKEADAELERRISEGASRLEAYQVEMAMREGRESRMKYPQSSHVKARGLLFLEGK